MIDQAIPAVSSGGTGRGLRLYPAQDDKANPSSGDWRVYAGDQASTKFTPLDGITAANFANLEIAWQWATADQPILDADTTIWTGRYEATPLAIDGILYTTTSLSQAVAIDGPTGQTLWTYDPGSWRDGTPPNVGFVHRGLTLVACASPVVRTTATSPSWSLRSE